MNKKVIAILVVTIVFGIALKWYITLPSNSPKSDSNTATDTAALTTDDTSNIAPDAPETPVETTTSVPRAETPLNDVKFDLGLTPASTEDELVKVMHVMSHQKVRAEQKWGALPMTAHTIRQVHEVVTLSSFEHKSQLLDILNKWKNGDFKSADADHNYLWGLQGGSEGKAYGLLSPTEEQNYFESNFLVDENGVATYLNYQ
ncbi:PRK06770 family protein [Bacillus sp. ISL-75]|uniref:DUF6241 domain-containing protein n=1 Tax=Bacillus sp. ISL-75 TaxID=2819137 RepID=UPI001BE81707|nr:DUF6241 domain-containing protein [Bacillus sp. ISL-75]MBT2730553.1 PRK06770 family protein [Bacillus sp. ISL-75]